MPPSSFLEICGIRYVRPFVQELEYSVRDRFVGLPVSVVLAMVFSLGKTNRWQAEVADLPASLREAWANEARGGRVSLCRHRNSRDDNRPFCNGFRPVLDPDMLLERMDRLKRTTHVHELAGLPLCAFC